MGSWEISSTCSTLISGAIPGPRRSCGTRSCTCWVPKMGSTNFHDCVMADLYYFYPRGIRHPITFAKVLAKLFDASPAGSLSRDLLVVWVVHGHELGDDGKCVEEALKHVKDDGLRRELEEELQRKREGRTQEEAMPGRPYGTCKYHLYVCHPSLCHYRKVYRRGGRC